MSMSPGSLRSLTCMHVDFYFFAHFKEANRDRVCVCVCMCVCVCVVCPSQAIPLKLLMSSSNTVTVSVTRMHDVLIILALTFIQGWTDRNHDFFFKSIISETIQAMPAHHVGYENSPAKGLDHRFSFRSMALSRTLFKLWHYDSHFAWSMISLLGIYIYIYLCRACI